MQGTGGWGVYAGERLQKTEHAEPRAARQHILLERSLDKQQRAIKMLAKWGLGWVGDRKKKGTKDHTPNPC